MSSSICVIVIYPCANLFLVIPNVFEEENGKKLVGYEGSWAYIATIAWSKVSKAGKVGNGDFPSKGIM